MHAWLRFDPAEARRVIVAFLEAYLRDSGASGIVLGLSGGLDSAVVAALCVEALGAPAVHAVALPGPTSSPEDARLAGAVATTLGIQPATIPIGGAVDALRAAAGPDRRVLANLQPRLRMAVLYAHANARRALVAGTGNKSELLTGYFTKYGDGGADLQPIGDLYKTQVRRLADDLPVPDEVRTRAPTAGLWSGQTDEAELGLPYERLDVVLAGLETSRGPHEIAREAGVSGADVERVAGMVRASWHKRSPPPVPKLAYRTPGVDWREPLSFGAPGRGRPDR